MKCLKACYQLLLDTKKELFNKDLSSFPVALYLFDLIILSNRKKSGKIAFQMLKTVVNKILSLFLHFFEILLCNNDSLNYDYW